jgi:hypothetical protein
MVASHTSTHTRRWAAVIGAGAVITMGALGFAFHQEQVSGGATPVYLSGGGMTVGNTATTTVDIATEVATAKAVPPVKATPFGES